MRFIALRSGAVEARLWIRSAPARGGEPRDVLLLAAHPLDAVAGVDGDDLHRHVTSPRGIGSSEPPRG